jgi:hypothetical protein
MTFAIPSAHADDAPYALAFLSSTAIEVAAVAFLLFLMVSAALGRSPLAGIWSRAWRGATAAGVYKLAIPIACLTLTVWGWVAARGA